MSHPLEGVPDRPHPPQALVDAPTDARQPPQVPPSRWEPRIYVSLCLLLFTLLTLPYARAMLRNVPGRTFSGALNLVEDNMGYFEMIKQAEKGRFLFEENFSSEPQPRNLVLPLWWVIGRVSALSRLSLAAVFHLSRILLSAAFLLAAYPFIRRAISDVRVRLFCYVLVLFGSGLGWTALLFPIYTPGTYPVDRTLPDAFIFSALYLNAHWAAGLALILSSFLLLLKGLETRRPIFGAGAGLACFVLSFVHPYGTPLVLAVSLAYVGLLAALRKETAARVVLPFFGLSIAGAALMFGIIESNPVTRAIGRSLAMPSGHPLSYLLGLAPASLLAFFGLHRVIRDRMEPLYLPACWVVTAFVLAYAPVFFQRRMVIGVYLPLCMLAAVGAFDLLMKMKLYEPRRGLRALGALLLGLTALASIPSNAYVLARDMSQTNSPAFLPRDLGRALDWLDHRIEPGEIVLASRETGTYVPARTGAKSFLGHWCLTLNSRQKTGMLESFMDPARPDEFRRAMARDFRLSYFIFGDFEKRLGGFDPEGKNYLRRVYTEGSVAIYKFQENAAPVPPRMRD